MSSETVIDGDLPQSTEEISPKKTEISIPPSDSPPTSAEISSKSPTTSEKRASLTKTGSLLREIALVVAVEDRDLSNSTDLLIEAADQVALQRGLISPLRGRRTPEKSHDSHDESEKRVVSRRPSEDRGGSTKISDKSFADNSNTDKSDRLNSDKLEKSDGVNLNRLNPDKSDKSSTDTTDDVDALLSAIQPNDKRGEPMPILKRGNSNNKFDDDVSTLFASRKGIVQKTRPPTKPHQRNQTANGPQGLSGNTDDRNRYLQKLSVLDKRDSDNDFEDENDIRRNENRPSRSKLSAVASHLSKSRDDVSNRNSKSLFSSYTEEMLFRTMRTAKPSSRTPGSAPGRPSSSSASKDKNRLATPHSSFNHTAEEIKRDPTLRYTRYEDAKECTFRPQCIGREAEKKKSRGDDDEDQPKESPSAFMDRQEAKERTRRTELDLAIGKAAYDKLIDKRQCPVCTAKQSYDEVKEKRKECPNCRVEYKRQTVWGNVGEKFFQREKSNAIKMAENKELIRQEMADESQTIEKHVYDRKTGKITLVKEIIQINDMLSTPESELEFHLRNEERLMIKAEKLRLLENSTHNATCTFQPNIERKDRRDDDETLDPVGAFMSRMTEDWEGRLTNNPERYVTKADIEKMEAARMSAFK